MPPVIRNIAPVRQVLLVLIGFLLLPVANVLGGSLPRFQEKLEPGRMSPTVEYEVPYVDNRIEEKYASLAEGSRGRYYSAIDCPLILAIHRVLEDNLVRGADIVFVIDHTSSMKDDIEEVAQELKTIIEKLDQAGDIRLGVVSFSDVKTGTEYGYRSLDLNGDFSEVGAFLDDIDLVGSVEDIYGAVWKTVDEFSWKSKTKRMIVVIGDEEPAIGRETNYTEADVFSKCKSMQVAANLYPVLIDKNEN